MLHFKELKYIYVFRLMLDSGASKFLCSVILLCFLSTDVFIPGLMLKQSMLAVSV